MEGLERPGLAPWRGRPREPGPGRWIALSLSLLALFVWGSWERRGGASSPVDPVDAPAAGYGEPSGAPRAEQGDAARSAARPAEPAGAEQAGAEEAPERDPTEGEPLLWWVEAPPLLAPQTLADCLATTTSAPPQLERGERGGELLLRWSGARSPQRLRREGDLQRGVKLWLLTPQGDSAWRQLEVHLQTAGCLSSPESTLHDPLLGRSWGSAQWPRLGEGGAIPLSEAIQTQRSEEGGYESLGLRRLGLPELRLAIDSPLARRVLLEASGALIMKPSAAEDDTLQLRAQTVRLAAARGARAAAPHRSRGAAQRS